MKSPCRAGAWKSSRAASPATRDTRAQGCARIFKPAALTQGSHRFKAALAKRHGIAKRPGNGRGHPSQTPRPSVLDLLQQTQPQEDMEAGGSSNIDAELTEDAHKEPRDAVEDVSGLAFHCHGCLA